MLSYCHSFHAGNQADVFKHALLFAFLSRYIKKRKPFTAFDVHAGSGVYNLMDMHSVKTGEASTGIIPLLALYADKKLPKPIPEDFENYLLFCKKNYDNAALYYGSPAIIHSFLDEHSHLVLSDLHPAAVDALKQRYQSVKNVHVHKRNGYEAVVALSPPKPVRGFAFFDPSYELPSDYTDVDETIKKLQNRWYAGSFIVWYPIVERRAAQMALLKRNLMLLEREAVLNFEIIHFNSKMNETDSGYGLKGSGMCIINPPFGFKEKAGQIAAYLQDIAPLFVTLYDR